MAETVTETRWTELMRRSTREAFTSTFLPFCTALQLPSNLVRRFLVTVVPLTVNVRFWVAARQNLTAEPDVNTHRAAPTDGSSA